MRPPPRRARGSPAPEGSAAPRAMRRAPSRARPLPSTRETGRYAPRTTQRTDRASRQPAFVPLRGQASLRANPPHGGSCARRSCPRWRRTRGGRNPARVRTRTAGFRLCQWPFQGLAWNAGIEPAAARSTIWCSTSELVPRRGWDVRSLGTHRAMVSVSAPGGHRNPRRRTRAREPNHGSAGTMKKAPAGEPTGAFRATGRLLILAEPSEWMRKAQSMNSHASRRSNRSATPTRSTAASMPSSGNRALIASPAVLPR